MSTDFIFLVRITIQDIIDKTDIKVIAIDGVPDHLSYNDSCIKLIYDDDLDDLDYLNCDFTLTRYGLNDPSEIIEILMETFELTDDDIYID